MATVAEIDEAGRFVVPKQMRDALHLVPGTRILLEQEGGSIVIRPEEPTGKLVRHNGVLAWDPGVPSSFDIVQALEEDREERMRAILGDGPDL